MLHQDVVDLKQLSECQYQQRRIQQQQDVQVLLSKRFRDIRKYPKSGPSEDRCCHHWSKEEREPTAVMASSTNQA